MVILYSVYIEKYILFNKCHRQEIRYNVRDDKFCETIEREGDEEVGGTVLLS
jgi:hypothetical protein